MIMARYDYRCTNCDTVFEVEHGMLEHPKIVCPNCGSTAVNRVFDVSGIVFKGSGFYNTDQRDKGSSTPSTSAEIAKTTSGTKQISKTDKGPKTLAKSADKPAATNSAAPKAAASKSSESK